MGKKWAFCVLRFPECKRVVNAMMFVCLASVQWSTARTCGHNSTISPDI